MFGLYWIGRQMSKLMSAERLAEIQKAVKLAKKQESFGTAHLRPEICLKTEIAEELLEGIDALTRVPVVKQQMLVEGYSTSGNPEVIKPTFRIKLFGTLDLRNYYEVGRLFSQRKSIIVEIYEEDKE